MGERAGVSIIFFSESPCSGNFPYSFCAHGGLPIFCPLKIRPCHSVLGSMHSGSWSFAQSQILKRVLSIYQWFAFEPRARFATLFPGQVRAPAVSASLLAQTSTGDAQRPVSSFAPVTFPSRGPASSDYASTGVRRAYCFAGFEEPSAGIFDPLGIRAEGILKGFDAGYGEELFSP